MKQAIRLRGRPWMTLGLVGAGALLQALGEEALAALAWRSDLWATGEWWRLAGGHLVHWTWEHLGWDMLAVAALGVWLEGRGRRGTMVVAAVATVAASGALLEATGRFESYRGVSGVAVALYVLGLGELASGGGWRRWAGWAGAVGLAGKLCWEAWVGEAWLAGAGGTFQVAWEAHAAGALGGGLALVAWFPRIHWPADVFTAARQGFEGGASTIKNRQ